MAEISFDEEQQYQTANVGLQKSFFVRIVLNTGIVSTEKAAEYVLVALAGLLLLVSAFIFFGIGGKKNAQLPPGAQIINVPDQPPRLLESIPGRN